MSTDNKNQLPSGKQTEASVPEENYKEEVSFEPALSNEKKEVKGGPSDNTIPINDIKADLYGKMMPPEIIYKKKERKGRKIALLIVCALLGLSVGVLAFGLTVKSYLMNQITEIPSEASGEITVINESGETVKLEDLTETTLNAPIQSESVKNFMLLGIDSRSNSYSQSGKGSRADVIMIMSIDNNKGTVKLLSVARDSYAYFPGYKNPHKINASMSFGGPAMLQATLENTLRIKIDGYAYVNFNNMAKVIDSVGGVYVNATKSEVNGKGGINYHLKALYGEGAPLVSTSGKNTWLNGRQAVAYARIRYIGNGDYERSERQVEVLRSLLKQFQSKNAVGKAACMVDILSCIMTNIPKEDIEHYAFQFLPSVADMKIQYFQLPIKKCFYSGMYGDEWSIRPNWNAMIPYVQKYFYDETKEFDLTRDIPRAPALNKCPADLNLEDLVK